MYINEAVKKETIHITLGTAAGAGLMLLVFFLLHRTMPGIIPFDHTVIAGAAAGTTVAAANFFLMGITVQKVTSVEDEKKAYEYMRTSYHLRLALQLLWVAIVMTASWINSVAGIIPLFIPSICIKGMGAFGMTKDY